MKTLIELTQESHEQQKLRAQIDRIELEAKRVGQLQTCLAGFDYEIKPDSTCGDCIRVALRHPKQKNTWLCFSVDDFGANSEPVLPDKGRVIRIYAGDIDTWPVDLAEAAGDYVAREKADEDKEE